MTLAHGPAVGRRRLRLALRAAREAADLTQERVAAEMDWSLSKLIRIESGQVTVSVNDVRALLSLYDVHDDERVAQLVELARAARKRPWWNTYREHLTASVSSFIGLEAETSAMSYYNALLIPGLLQTEAYARVVLREAMPAESSPEDIEAVLRVRLTRQHEVLTRSTPADIVVILDEAVLRRTVGGPETMREQLRRLAGYAAQPRVTIHVIPFSAGPYPAMYGPFIILEFPDPNDPPVVFLELPFSGEALERSGEVEPYRRAFARMLEMALSAHQSLMLIRSVADGLA
jgi:transcriptional regulator with XRE-family HTH domain